MIINPVNATRRIARLSVFAGIIVLLAVGVAAVSNAAAVGPDLSPAAVAARSAELLPAGTSGAVPTGFQPIWLTPAVFVPALILWATLAFLRARRLDANFSRRRARRQLAKLTHRLAAANSVPSDSALEHWCELTARILSVPRAAPTAEDIVRAMGTTAEITDQTAWRRLWHEARESLFSGRKTLAPDWATRADQALQQTKIERASSVFPTLRTHWIPRVAAVLLMASMLVAFTSLHAATPEESYRQGKFEDAQVGWNAYLALHPRDWAAHNNAGLAASHQEKWGAAQAHWTAAFLLAPRNRVVRDNLQLALSRVDRVDPVLRLALEGNWHERALAYCSPGEWQEISWISLVLGSVGLGLAVVGLYRGKSLLRIGSVAAVVGLIGLVSSTVSLRNYGLLAQPNAACLTRQTDLRAVPSDLVEIQQTAPLLAGTMVTVDGYFFGWSRILGRGNVTGWVRSDAVLPLYAALDKNGASGFTRAVPVKSKLPAAAKAR